MRTQLRKKFDQDAIQYHEARPGYPPELFEDIFGFSNLPKDGRILEIGCGTGQATIPFAQRGYSILCIELGENLAALARKKLALYPEVAVSTGAFEKYPLEEGSFDLVISATAFHWIDPAIKYYKVARALKAEGAIALFWTKHVQTELSASFVHSVQRVYQQFAPSMAKKFTGLPQPDKILFPVKEEIDQSGEYGDVLVKKYKWDRAYTSIEYTKLLGTYSDHISLDETTRCQLFAGIQNHIDTQFGGQIIKEHLTLLYLAKRKNDEHK